MASIGTSSLDGGLSTPFTMDYVPLGRQPTSIKNLRSIGEYERQLVSNLYSPYHALISLLH